MYMYEKLLFIRLRYDLRFLWHNSVNFLQAENFYLHFLSCVFVE